VSPFDLWHFLPVGYLLTIAIETPILFFGLSPPHSKRRRIFAGLWLTACTYPIVTLVLPLLLVDHSRGVYLLIAEVFAPVAECLLFWLAFGKEAKWRDFAVIVVANVASFLIGEMVL
jgi:hypothetical protein